MFHRTSKNSESDLYTADGIVYNKHGQIVQELMDITGAWKRYSSECLRKLTPAKLFTRRPSDLPELPPGADFGPFMVPPAGKCPNYSYLMIVAVHWPHLAFIEDHTALFNVLVNN